MLTGLLDRGTIQSVCKNCVIRERGLEQIEHLIVHLDKRTVFFKAVIWVGYRGPQGRSIGTFRCYELF